MTLPLSTRLSFAASGTATGLIANGVQYFLLLYYSQVLGLNPFLAGLAMMIALVFDAISDPLIGRWSDRMNHRLGRRHPFLFFAIVPAALAYYLLWDPPALSEAGLFWYLLGVAIALRLTLTTHAVPFNALLPELAGAYDDRTKLMNYSYSASWFFGTLMAVAMYAYWLADTPDYPDGAGILRADGYVQAGAVAAVGAFVCMLYAALATRRYIPDLAPPPPDSTSVRQMLREVGTTLNDRSFLAMLMAGTFSFAASGTSTALWAYMQTYFWGFDSEQISAMLAAQLLSAVLAFGLIPKLTRNREKRGVLIQMSIASMVVGTGPVFLSLLGLFPGTDHAALYPTMLVVGVVQVTLIVITSTLTASMIADIVEHRELVTGRREEGLLFSVQSFIGKVAGGVGVLTGGVMLGLIEFPTNTAAVDVAREIVERLGWLYGPTLAVFYSLSIVALGFYQIDRQAHERNLEALGRSQPIGRST
ncbi:MAG: MFS transporter [Gammaproteobacteria bacterium]|nr:MFS transporter [Gammaproteobacteria bacterium]